MNAIATAALPTCSSSASTSHATQKHLSLLALGVVFGDIGTSPLYAVKACFFDESTGKSLDLNIQNVVGIISLILFAIGFVVIFKYINTIMRADNHSEGGILALLALVQKKVKTSKRKKIYLTALGLFGATLLYGDGVITPAISVLGALEGLEVVTTKLHPFIVPGSVTILVALFLLQKKGTAKVGVVFGHLMKVWFGMIAVIGIPWIYRYPRILEAFLPWKGLFFLKNHGSEGFTLLGAVVLCVTGGEALYADMGHFGGVQPIRHSWKWIVFPALVLNYLGQGAYLLQGNITIDANFNPFYRMIPHWGLYPAVVIATCAAIIASQALISGAFSLTQQAIQLGYLPRSPIIHTSGEHEGQIYVPQVNWLLMVGCIGLVLWFGSSSRLAAAYGISVTGTMAITSILFGAVAPAYLGWSHHKAYFFTTLFLVVDIAFFSANMLKFFKGGYVPMTIAIGLFAYMLTWKKGREVLSEIVTATGVDIGLFAHDSGWARLQRVSGVAVFTSSNSQKVPNSLLHHLKHNRVLHEIVIIATVVYEHSPEVKSDRVKIIQHRKDFYQVLIHTGFMQDPNVPEALKLCRQKGLCIYPDKVSYYVGRESLLVQGKSRMPRFQALVFAWITRNAQSAADYFSLPPGQVVELGCQVVL